MHLSSFSFLTQIVEAADATVYTGEIGDSVIYWDARTLPEQIQVLLGLVEVGGYDSILPVHALGFIDLRLVHLVTNTVPWIYVMVASVEPGASPLSDGDVT